MPSNDRRGTRIVNRKDVPRFLTAQLDATAGAPTFLLAQWSRP